MREDVAMVAGVDCPICGKRYSTLANLMKHLRRVHGVENPKEFLSNPSLWAQAAEKAAETAEAEEEEKAVEEEKAEEEERDVFITVRGIRLTRGDCIRVIISRNTFIVRIHDFSEAVPVVVGEDIYGNQVSVDLRKALVIAKISPEKFEEIKKRAREMEIRRRSKE